MRIRVLTWASVAVLAANSLTCHGQTKPARPSPPPAVEAKVLPPASQEGIAVIKNLLFADVMLDELMRQPTAETPDSDKELNRSLTQAVEDVRRGRTAEAKRKLKQVLSRPNLETRVGLVAWNTLRKLGERPPPGVAARVQGVVMELHNEAGVGTLAAYADGRVRFIGGQGKISILELPSDDPDIGPFVKDFLQSAEPIVRRAPAAERRRPGEPPLDHFRVSVLTYGGIHVVEVFGPGVTAEHVAGPVLYTGSRLVEAVLKFEEEHPSQPEPGPGGTR